MGIRIELPEPVWEKLLEEADREYRTPKQQCEYLLIRALGFEFPLGKFVEDEDQPPESVNVD